MSITKEAVVEEATVKEGLTKEEKRLSKVKQFLIPAIVLTVVTFLMLEKITPLSAILPEMLQVTIIIANIGIVIYCGSIFYFFKIIGIPFRMLRGFGGLGLLLALFIWFFFTPVIMLSYMWYPVIPLLMEGFFLQKSLKECE